MSRTLDVGTKSYRGHIIIRRHYETASVFKDGLCIACGFSTIQSAKKWVDETLQRTAAMTEDQKRKDDERLAKWQALEDARMKREAEKADRVSALKAFDPNLFY